MFSRNILWAAVLTATFMASPSASAQFYGNNGCSSCAQSAPAPMVSSCAPAITSCAPVQPIISSCYQTVPVTTYRAEKQTVREPYYKTSYETRDVTVYEPVSERKMVSVPTVSYKTVYDTRTVNKDRGRWQTNYHPVAKCAPCQVDPRPGMIGWLNRTGYSFRSAFVPKYRTSRQYVPNMVTCNVQVPRQVAVHGTKQVAQVTTRMVAKKVAQRVQVRKLAWREKEITVNRPVTAYQTVPYGSSLAYGYGGYGYPSSSIAYIDEDGDDTSRTARRGPEPDSAFDEGLRSADEMLRDDGDRQRTSDKKLDDTDRFQRTSRQRVLDPVEGGLRPAPQTYPQDDAPQPDFGSFETGQRASRYNNRQASYSYERRPAAPRGWTASRRSSERTASTDKLTIPGVSVTDRN